MANESEQEKRETLADIVAEMRTRSREVKEAFGGRPDGVENMLDIWANRIEAAWKRDEERAVEHATRHAESVARDNCRDCVHNPNGKNYAPVGNAAAMREALEKAKKAICHHAENICQSLSWENSNIQSNCADVLCAHRDLCEAKTAINIALSAPARNCDIMSRSICTKHFSTIYEGNRDGLCDVQTEREKNIRLYYIEFNKWLFATAGRKGDGDGR